MVTGIPNAHVLPFPNVIGKLLVNGCQCELLWRPIHDPRINVAHVQTSYVPYIEMGHQSNPLRSPTTRSVRGHALLNIWRCVTSEVFLVLLSDYYKVEEVSLAFGERPYTLERSFDR